MRNKDKVLDDLARVAGGAVSVFGGMRRNIGQDIKSRTDEVATRLNLVPREDFENLETALQETRKIQQDLEQRLSKLENALKNKDKK